MTQCDETLGKDTSYEYKSLEEGINMEKSLAQEAPKNDNNCDEQFEISKNNITVKPIERSSEEISPEMGSTDSASGTQSGGSSCGLVGSLFPNSCRGRAESFARRLHRRLTSLGGDGHNSSEDESGVTKALNKATETSWLHASTGQRTMTNAPSNSATSLSLKTDERVFDSQPHHSLESDIYHDLDLDPADDYHETPDGTDYHETPDGTDSPVEMANPTDLANILVNHSNHHESCKNCQQSPRPPEFCQDRESACAFSSPLAGTSSETSPESFYDPECSESEKSPEEIFLDPQPSTDSEVTSGFSNGIAENIRKVPLRRKISESTRLDDNSESSTSSCDPQTLENSPEAQVVFAESSEESLNGKSSLETTSPSHESLWSTFDDSTVSLPDEATFVLQNSATISVSVQTSLPKSHSDSEIIVNRAEERLTNGDDDKDKPEVESGSTYSSSLEIPGPLILECQTGRRIATLEESLKNQVNLRIDDANREEGMARLLERLACSPNIDKIEIEKSLDEETKITNGKEPEEEGTDQEQECEEPYENQEDMEERPQRVRRCSSLKTGKTPPGTPGRKKIVRFADVLGLDLADVRTFLDEIPKIPNSAYSDLIYDEAFQKDSSPVNFWGTGPATFTTPLYAATMPRGLINGLKLDRTLVPLFQQPGGLSNFLDLVRQRQVCLENVLVQDPVNMCLQGTVRVRNLDFHKSVHVRYSLDSWRNFSDLQAIYASNSCDGFSDKFTFHLYCHTIKVGQRLELAVRFQCKGAQYWDNNAGANYCFQCLPATPSNPCYLPITSSPVATTGENLTTANPHDWSPTFY